MNQVTNLIQWKNLSKDEQDGFDFDNYKYECQCSMNDRTDWIKRAVRLTPHSQDVYRLVIQPEKFYYWASIQGGGVALGKDLLVPHHRLVLRPATEAEIPKPATLEERVKAEYPDFEVVMLEWGKGEDSDLLLMVSSKRKDWVHIMAQGMKGFYRYVYDLEDGNWPDIRIGFLVNREPTFPDSKGRIIHPIAALLSRGEG